VYLTPVALEEITDLLGWGGFGLRAHRTGTTPLLRMVEQNVRLHPAVTLREHTAEGVAPDFQSAGFIRPPEVRLIEQGAYRDCLVSPRSAQEYEAVSNGADGGEMPLSLDMAAGTIPTEQVLHTLGTGLLIGNLWYLNYSDRNAARLTGMTRFATFWVENGEIQAPVNVMRFDDSLYRLLGGRLLGLTAERELLLDPGSYGGRSSRSSRLPGVVIEEMNFTL
jgi:predicted Zn-dependent protease